MNLGVELRSWRVRARAESYPESFPSEPDCVDAVASVGGVASKSGTMVEMNWRISSTSCSRPVAIRSRAMACAANSEALATRISASGLNNSRRCYQRRGVVSDPPV